MEGEDVVKGEKEGAEGILAIDEGLTLRGALLTSRRTAKLVR